VLAALGLTPGEVVGVDRLVDAVWAGPAHRCDVGRQPETVQRTLFRR
jgi:hypothetical protein